MGNIFPLLQACKFEYICNRFIDFFCLFTFVNKLFQTTNPLPSPIVPTKKLLPSPVYVFDFLVNELINGKMN